VRARYSLTCPFTDFSSPPRIHFSPPQIGLSKRQLFAFSFPSMDSYTSSSVIFPACFCNTKPPPGPRIERTSPALERRCSTLERCASEACSAEAIFPAESALSGSTARRTIACIASEVASDIFEIFVIAGIT